MIKATAGNLLLIGLSDENIRRMKSGLPIAFDLPPGFFQPDHKCERIAVFWGATERDMREMLKPYTDSNTHIVGEEN